MVYKCFVFTGIHIVEYRCYCQVEHCLWVVLFNPWIRQIKSDEPMAPITFSGGKVSSSGNSLVVDSVGTRRLNLFRPTLNQSNTLIICIPKIGIFMRSPLIWCQTATPASVTLYWPSTTRRWPNVGVLLGHRRRRWANNYLTLGRRIVFAGCMYTKS